jgi:hypothetical protein
MIAILFLPFTSCSRSLSSVLTGIWFTTTTYSSPSLNLPPFNISVNLTGTSRNYLSSIFHNNSVQINLSFTDLSGNLTYRNETYHFLFVERAPPFLSTDIDFREFGSSHCIIPTLQFARCSFLGPNGAISVTLRKQADESETDWSQLWKAGIVIVIGVAAHWALGQYLEKQQGKLEEEMKEKRRKAAEEKAKMEEEKEPEKLKTE